MPCGLGGLLSATDEQRAVLVIQILERYDGKVTIGRQMVFLVLDPSLACPMASGGSFVALPRETDLYKLVPKCQCPVRPVAREPGKGRWVPSHSLVRSRVIGGRGASVWVGCAHVGYVCGSLAREANFVGLRVLHDFVRDQGTYLSLFDIPSTHERPPAQVETRLPIDTFPAVVHQESQN